MPCPANDDQHSQVSRPIHLFIDTSVYYQRHFPFGLVALQGLANRMANGDIILLTPSVILDEILVKAEQAVSDSEKAHRSFIRDTAIMRTAYGEADLPPGHDEIPWDDLRERVSGAARSFLTGPGARVLDTAHQDTGEVFKDYFAGRPPFGKGKKKSEFPDAFAVQALLRFARAEECTTYVLSNDGDWKAACDTHEHLEEATSLSMVLALSQPDTWGLQENLKGALEPHAEEIQRAILKEFPDRGFYLDPDDGIDTEVHEITDLEIIDMSATVATYDHGKADLELTVEVEFTAYATRKDPDSCFRDSDTKELLYLGSEDLELRCHHTVTASLMVDVDPPGMLVTPADAPSLNIGDVWISEYEIESVEKEVDRESWRH